MTEGLDVPFEDVEHDWRMAGDDAAGFHCWRCRRCGAMT